MTIKELLEEIHIELELIETTLKEISDLTNDIADREPAVREKTAAAAFMAQFYGGIENILKRISRFHNIPLPGGETWHIDLFKRFCKPPYKSLPLLFDEELLLAMAPFRKFRHVVYHGYGFQLDWDRMKEGLSKIDNVFLQFKMKLLSYLQTLKI
ncbi:MAG: hypothetical protein HY758_08025 [Nitrospirae bacterium]|nr:hypothetical protein [Nitrospirota bacterium]